MRRTLTSTLAVMMLGVTTTAYVTPADAQRRYSERERYVERYCERHPRDRDCRDFRRGHRNWDDARYKRWYRERHRDNDNPAAALFGFAAGAILGGAASSAGNNTARVSDAHVRWCHDQYRSYRASDNTFQPYNGPRRQCNSPYN